MLQGFFFLNSVPSRSHYYSLGGGGAILKLVGIYARPSDDLHGLDFGAYIQILPGRYATEVFGMTSVPFCMSHRTPTEVFLKTTVGKPRTPYLNVLQHVSKTP